MFLVALATLLRKKEDSGGAVILRTRRNNGSRSERERKRERNGVAYVENDICNLSFRFNFVHDEHCKKMPDAEIKNKLLYEKSYFRLRSSFRLMHGLHSTCCIHFSGRMSYSLPFRCIPPARPPLSLPTPLGFSQKTLAAWLRSISLPRRRRKESLDREKREK